MAVLENNTLGFPDSMATEFQEYTERRAGLHDIEGPAWEVT